MAKLAALVLVSCVVLLVGATGDDDHQQHMSLFFRQEKGGKMNSFPRDSWSQSEDQETTTDDSWIEPETEDSNSWFKPSFESFRQDRGIHRKNPFRQDSRRSQPSRWDDSLDEQTTTEESWTEPETEESNSWNQHSSDSIRQDYGKRRMKSFRRDSRREQPSRRRSSLNQYTTTEYSWTEPETEESNSWNNPTRLEDSWPHELPSSQDSWMDVHHFSNEMAPEVKSPWNDDSWLETTTDSDSDVTEASRGPFEVESSGKPASCYQRPERGSCEGRKTRYYYDTETQSCKIFVWSGCEGNQNRFKTREMCESTCGERPSNIPPGFKCKRDGLYKHPTTCEKFIQCSNGRPYEQACPSGLHFSLASLNCQAPCDAFCDPSLSEECGWDSVGLRLTHSEFRCTRNGEYKHPESCEKFIQCSNGHPYEISCPSGLHFSEETGRCEAPCDARCDESLAEECVWSSVSKDCNALPDQGPCDSFMPRYYYDRQTNQCRRFLYSGCRGNSNNFRTQEECQRTCGSQNPSERFHCPRPNGRFGDMYDCTTYYQCQDMQSTLKKCPRGQWFDYKRRTCTSDQSAQCLYKCRQPEGMYTYLPDCKKYVQCSEGKSTVAKCESGKAFHKSKGLCLPQSETNCGIVPDNINVALTDSRDFLCPTPTGKYPKVDDCAKYWNCEHSIATEKDCELKFFNTETLECDDQKNVSCPAYEMNRKVICYFDNNTPSTGKFEPEDLSPYLCTHIHYARVNLEKSGDSWTILPSNRENDITLNYYQRVINLKRVNQKLKVLLTLGGWEDSDSAKYSQLISNVKNWPSFIDSVIQYLKLYGFDGLDFDWEFPVCRTKDCAGKDPSTIERNHFQQFLELMYTRFTQQNLLLSVRVSGEKAVFEKSYRMEDIGKHVDYLVVMAYLPPGESQSDTVPPSILEAGRNQKHVNEDATTIMGLWKDKVKDPKKLVLGIRANARVYQLSDTKKTDIYSPLPSHHTPPQDMSFRGVCAHMQSMSWKRGHSPQVADYIYHDVTWIGFQSPASLRKFAEHVWRHDYGGVALINNESDDFKGRCCTVKNPLLKGLVAGFSRRGMMPTEFGCP